MDYRYSLLVVILISTLASSHKELEKTNSGHFLLSTNVVLVLEVNMGMCFGLKSILLLCEIHIFDHNFVLTNVFRIDIFNSLCGIFLVAKL